MQENLAPELITTGFESAAMTAPSGSAGESESDGVDAPSESDAAGDRREVRLSVPDMDCPSCASKVASALDDVEGVRGHDTRPTAGTVVVAFDADRISTETVTAAVEQAGYTVDGGDLSAESVWTGERAVRTWTGAAVVAAGLVLEFLVPGANGTLVAAAGREVAVADALFLAGVVAAGTRTFRNGARSLAGRSLDIDLLMSIAILGAVVASLGFGESLYFEAATLAVLFGVAGLLERQSMDQARRSLRELMALSPDEATVRRDGEAVQVPASSLDVGDVVVVRPGDRVPTDGVVVEGQSAVDQSPVTGESVPVDKREGDEVYAGSVVEGGYLEVRVTAAGDEDTLSRIVDLVEAAESEQSDREQFVDRFAGYYTPAVVLMAVAVAVVPPLLFETSWVTHVVYGLTLLVLACPCAFVISTPVTVVSGITSAAKNGVLIKGGRHLEVTGRVGAVALDKTGTLTRGELTVTDVVPLNGNSEAAVLRCARGLEERSEHPIGEAIVDHAADRSLDPADVDAFESITGRGVRAELDGTRHYAGTTDLFEELGFDLSHVHATTDGGRRSTVDFRADRTTSRSDDGVARTAGDRCERSNCLDLLAETVPDLQAEGKTVVLVGTETEIEGVVAVADEVRPEAVRTVERLRERGLRTVMLTGDNERTARAIAETVGVDECRAALMPAEKVEAVRDLDAAHDGVAMVGDGVNDAPALATATVGVAMGAAGTDTALETADVALLGDDLSKLPYLHDLATRADGVIRQNVWASLAAKVLLAAGVPFGLVPIWLAVLAGDAGMTVGVTGNAMRLSRLRPDA